MENLCVMFKLFGLSHIIYLLMSIVLSVTLIFLFRKYDSKQRKKISLALLIAGGLFVALEFIGRVTSGAKVFESLPLAPWCIFLFLCIYVEAKNKISWIKFGYFVTLPLSVIALFIVPNFYTTINGFSLAIISYFMVNVVLIVYTILKLMWSEEYLYKSDIISTLFNYIIIVASVHMYNVFARFTTLGVHSNYFGTMGEDYDVVMKLLYKLIPVPFAHLIPLIVLLFGIQFLLILPFDLVKTRKDRKEQMEEIIALGNLKAQQQARKSGKRSKSQILVRSETKAQPEVQKTNRTEIKKDGFVSVNKSVQVNNKDNQ